MAITPDTTFTVDRENFDGNHAFHGTVASGAMVTVLLESNGRFWEIMNRNGAGELFFLVDWDGVQDISADTEGAHVLPAAISARTVAMTSKNTYLRLSAVGGVVDYTLTLVS